MRNGVWDGQLWTAVTASALQAGQGLAGAPNPCIAANQAQQSPSARGSVVQPGLHRLPRLQLLQAGGHTQQGLLCSSG
jgi:hypothetical protein